MSLVVFGLDPSSRKLAIVATVDGQLDKVFSRPVPKQNGLGRAHGWAFLFINQVVKSYSPEKNKVVAFIEAPVLIPRAGAKAIIPQAQMNGLLHGAFYIAGIDSYNVEVAKWKKEAIGNGNASKALIKRSMKEQWPMLYEKWSEDQDVLDAGGINIYGQRTLAKASHFSATMEE